METHVYPEPEFRPPAAFHDASPPAASINYSPKHSRVPSSLSTSRNINIKRLAVSPTASGASSPRRKPLALAIPVSASSPIYSSTPVTPSRSSQHQDHNQYHNHQNQTQNSHDPNHNQNQSQDQNAAGRYTTPERWPGSAHASHDLSRDLRSPFSSRVSCNSSAESLSGRLSEVALSSPQLSPYQKHPTLDPSRLVSSRLDSSRLDSSRLESSRLDPSRVDHRLESRAQDSPLGSAPAHIPEELQESSNTNAYPRGPANVLNSIVYLFSDPRTSSRPVDINDYDLVINVARECDDLSSQFDSRNGTRKYIRVPWSHTSAISEELPRLTEEIARMDVPGKKVLVHCQCGVSRSACVVVAYFMVKFNISVNDAYELLKSGTQNVAEETTRRIGEAGNYVEPCERVCPNMSLIFELMDFGDRR